MTAAVLERTLSHKSGGFESETEEKLCCVDLQPFDFKNGGGYELHLHHESMHCEFTTL